MPSFLATLRSLLKVDEQSPRITVFLPISDATIVQIHDCNREVFAERQQVFGHAMKLVMRTSRTGLGVPNAPWNAASASAPAYAVPTMSNNFKPEPSQSYRAGRVSRPSPRSANTNAQEGKSLSGPDRPNVAQRRLERREARNKPVCERCYALKKRCDYVVPGLPCDRCLRAGEGECHIRIKRRELCGRKSSLRPLTGQTA